MRRNFSPTRWLVLTPEDIAEVEKLNDEHGNNISFNDALHILGECHTCNMIRGFNVDPEETLKALRKEEMNIWRLFDAGYNNGGEFDSLAEFLFMKTYDLALDWIKEHYGMRGEL